MESDLYFISVAARMLGMHPQTLRKYERLGLVQPTRTIGSMRLYSRDELERLRAIKRLVDDGGINLAGVQRLLSIAAIVERIRPLANQTRDDALPARDARRLSHELDELMRILGSNKSMDFKDYYSTLGVAKTATEKEIKQAYRKLARKHHPDVNPGDKSAEGRFKELNEAYEVLGDPAKRKKYDELGANWRMYEQAPGQPGGGPQAGGWNAHFGGSPTGAGVHTMTEEEMREMFGDANPFSDFFQTFFGGAGADPGSFEAETGGRRGRGGRARSARPGRDFEQEIELGLEDALRGATKRLSIKHDGQMRTVDVRIPAGIGDGSRVRVSGEGERGAGGARAGDLYLRVRLAPHPTFERKGKDLHTRVAVPLTTAVLGGEAEVATLAGATLRLKIPPTTQNGQVFRLKGHGMPVAGKPDQTGDLYTTVAVQLPRELTAEQRQHFEDLRKLEHAATHPAA